MSDVMRELERRLAAGQVLVLDGGTGSEIQARGVPMDREAWSAVANVTHGDLVRGIHEDYIRAGADILIANTFAAGVGALAVAGLGERVVEINQAAVALALQARDNVGAGSVPVAGSMSPMALGGSFTRDDTHSMLDGFRMQAHALADAGVDLIVLEMMHRAMVAECALRAARETGLPVWLGVSLSGVSDDGRLITVTNEDAGGLIELAREDAAALMVMHTDIDVVGQALPLVARVWDGPLVVYPHVGDWTPPTWTFKEISPDAFAAQVAPWAARGVQVLGGCCGIGPAHIAALRDALRAQGFIQR